MPDIPNNEPNQDVVTSLVNAEGALVEGWHNSEMLDESIRGHESLKTVTDLPNAFKQLVTANKMIGKNKVVLPGPNATDAEKAAFYDAIGRPKTPEDYKFDVPKGLEDVFTKDKMTKARAFAHQIGATQEQFAAYLKNEAESAATTAQNKTQQQEIDKQNAANEMHKRFGAAHDERMHIANRLISEICRGDADESRKIALLQAFGNNPDFIEFCSDCGAKLVEHKALIAELTQDTPKEAKARIAELRATPGFIVPDANGTLLANTDPNKKKAIMAEIDKLTEQAYPETRHAGRRY